MRNSLSTERRTSFLFILIRMFRSSIVGSKSRTTFLPFAARGSVHFFKKEIFQYKPTQVINAFNFTLGATVRNIKNRGTYVCVTFRHFLRHGGKPAQHHALLIADNVTALKRVSNVC